MKTRDLIIGVAFLIAASLWAIAAADEGQQQSITLPANVAPEVVTNVVEVDNGWGCRMASTNQFHSHNSGNFYAFHETCPGWTPPTERWVITNVVRVLKMTSEWRGQPISLISESVLNSTTQHWTLKQEWKESK